MISKEQLEQWEKQNAKDIQQYRKDEKYLAEMEEGQVRKVRSFFSRLRSKFLDFNTEEHHKLNRLLLQADINSQMENYPNLIDAYMAYNATFILTLAACIFIPKKLVSKVLSSIIIYGLKTNIGDGLFTYYSMREIALGSRMTQHEQQVRNILEFYYMSNRFNGKPMSEQQLQESSQLLQKIREQTDKFIKFRKLEAMV